MTPAVPRLRAASGRAVGSVAIAPTAHYKTSVAIRAGRTTTVKAVLGPGRVTVETSPQRTAFVRRPIPLAGSTSPRPVGPLVRRPSPGLRTALQQCTPAPFALTVMAGIPLAASSPWTTIPVALALLIIWILIPSEVNRAHRPPRA